MEKNIQEVVNALHGQVEDAHVRIRDGIRRTRLLQCRHLSKWIGGRVFLKLECEQRSGSFKMRGVLNKLMSLSNRDTFHYIAASTGNHGAAFAECMMQYGHAHTLFLPEKVAPSKLAYIRNLGTNVVLKGADGLEAELLAIEAAKEDGKVLIHPYDDLHIIAGQGTAAREMLGEVPDIDTIITPVGGGGLISGMMGWLQGTHANVEVIGCQPANSPDMVLSLQRGEITAAPIRSTLSDATAGGMVPDSVTFDLCRYFNPTIHLCSEEAIAEAIATHIDLHQLLVEGAAAMPLATLLTHRTQFVGKTVVLLLTGKRIPLEKLRTILSTAVPYSW